MFKMFFFITAIFAACTADTPRTLPTGRQALEANVNVKKFEPAPNVSIGKGIWAAYPRQGYEILLYAKDSVCHIERPNQAPYREHGVSIQPLGGGRFLCDLADGFVLVNAETGAAQIRLGSEAYVLEAE